MAAYLAVFLFLFFREGEGSGVLLAVRSADLGPLSSGGAQDSPRHKFTDKDGGGRRGEDGAKTSPHSFSPADDRKLNETDFKNNRARQIEALKRAETTAKTLGDEYAGNLSEKGDGLINKLSGGLERDIYSEAGVHFLPERTAGLAKWVKEAGSGGGGRDRLPAHSRRKRSWLWNQFFVIEEYRGPEPVLIGRVSLQKQKPQSQCGKLRNNVSHSKIHVTTDVRDIRAISFTAERNEAVTYI